MYVHNLDPLGYYVGSSVADANPEEPGQFILPAFATFDAPPPYNRATQLARYVSGAWVVEDIPQPEPAPAAVAPIPATVSAPVESYPHTFAGPEDMAREAQSRLLTGSDWVVIRATERGEPVPADWLAFRQAVRDADKQEGWPTNVEWPVAPGVTQ